MVILFLILQFRLPITEFILKNGLKVIVYEDHSVPVVSTQIWYRTGSYNDPKGKTGLSHLLEHMSFKGTKRLGPKEYDRIIEENGGEENAFTSHHYIAYYANLSRERWTIELKLEADRMINLRLDSLDLERERGVVLEELRLGVNDPFEFLWNMMRANAFYNSPYRNPIIGWEEDVKRIKRFDLLNYYRRYFNPANAVIVIAGDIDPAEARREVGRYFGRIRGKPVEVESIPDPAPIGERRFIIERGLENPILMIGYHTPPITDPDYFPCEVLFSILGRGRLSRLYRKLVYENGIATKVGVYYDDNRYPGLSLIYLYPRRGVEIDSLERAVYRVIREMADSITDEELMRVKNQIIAEFVYQQDGAFGIGAALGWAEVVGGSYHFIEEFPARIGRVDRNQVKQMIEKYLIPRKRVVGVIR
ncbi:insulinase family protein [candidate division WOR-3 bacterium]|uniref:Insulinase family protein n=1 Tax=candidate division WOR-3 bacterium TaxID=2052148 RepID=A0A660SKL3_UNCW3|nr:MAG: insulinase family protein [candidate division WOR-3 bacterium]